MKITVSLAAVAAGILEALGAAIVFMVLLIGSVPTELALLGFVLLILGGVFWIHHRMEVLAERLQEREWAAYSMGQLSVVRGGSGSPAPNPRVPQGL